MTEFHKLRLQQFAWKDEVLHTSLTDGPKIMAMFTTPYVSSNVLLFFVIFLPHCHLILELLCKKVCIFCAFYLEHFIIVFYN